MNLTARIPIMKRLKMSKMKTRRLKKRLQQLKLILIMRQTKIGIKPINKHNQNKKNKQMLMMINMAINFRRKKMKIRKKMNKIMVKKTLIINLNLKN